MSRPITNMSHRGKQVREASRRWWWKLVGKRRAQELTTRGTKPIYERHDIEAHGAERKRIRERIYVRRKNNAGLTRRGQPRRIGFRPTAQEQKWQMFRDSLNIKYVSAEDVQAERNRNYYTDQAARIGQA